MQAQIVPYTAPAGADVEILKTNHEGWHARYEIKSEQDILVDPTAILPFFGPETIFIKSYGDHPITKAFAGAGVPVLTSLVRSIVPGNAPGVKVTELMRASPQGWGETDRAHPDRAGKDAADVA